MIPSTSPRSLIALLVTLALPLAGCGASKTTMPAMPPTEVGVVTLTTQPVTTTTELTGRTTATVTSEVRPQVDGIIKA